jgi:hypothetical protein
LRGHNRSALDWRSRIVAVCLMTIAAPTMAGEVLADATSPETTGAPARISYHLDVAPIFSKAGCNTGTCHGNLNGKGGFKLSLRGDDPLADWLSITHETLARRIDTARSEASLLLRKPSGQVAHEGGLRFSVHSREYRTLHDWIAQGAADDESVAPRVLSLEVTPRENLVVSSSSPSGFTQRLSVMASLSDGTRRDVTSRATYEVNDPTRAMVSPEGVVTATKPGDIAVAVRFLQARATSRLAFVDDRPGYAWSGPKPANEIDQHVFAWLEARKLDPAPLCSDSVFVRRAFLDALGILPTPDEVREFLADGAPEKRARLIDCLLERPEFADFWALKWADLLRNEEKTMGQKGGWIFQRWLRDHVSRDVPLDQFARALITGQGSTWNNPPASFYRTNRDAQTAAEAVGQIFLGVRLQCARCHNHPFDVWTQDDYYRLAAGFANIERKQINNRRRDGFDKHEINSDEVIYLKGRPGMTQPRTGAAMSPAAPGTGPIALEPNDHDARDELADAITGGENRQFARVMANRVWANLLGRGIVEPVDDFRDSNPPSNPSLLEEVTDRFVAGDMRLKPLVRFIMLSHTYQIAAAAETESSTEPEALAGFGSAMVRLLPAEVLLDALSRALGASGDYSSAPVHARAVELAGIRSGGSFLKIFGKPDRLLTCECERSDATTLAQAFQLINGEAVRRKLEAPDNRIGRLLGSGAGDDSILEELYLAALSRFPSASERAGIVAHVGSAADRRRAWEDIAWALVNSKEFLLRH